MADTAQTISAPATQDLCPACHKHPVRCRGLCHNCRRSVARGSLPETLLAPRRPPGPPPAPLPPHLRR